MIYLMLYLAVIGLMAWALVTYVPMPAGIQKVIIIVAIVACVIVALNAFNVHLPSPGVPQLK